MILLFNFKIILFANPVHLTEHYNVHRSRLTSIISFFFRLNLVLNVSFSVSKNTNHNVGRVRNTIIVLAAGERI